MEIVGKGFLARHLRAIAHRHADVVALAAGVSWAADTSDTAFGRETALVRDTAARCRETGRTLLFFSTSSAAVYGADRPGRESDPAVPHTPYGDHKLALERLLRESGTAHLVLRLSHVVGPGQPPHQLLPSLTRLVRAGGPVRVQRHATRDLIGVRDAVTLIDALLSRGERGGTVNLASGHAVPVGDIVDHLERRIGVAARREYIAGGAAHLVSVERLRALLPGQVAALGFDAGYHRRVIDSFLAERQPA
ncbi:SDR family oxidoreductase [Spirillospora sp. NPDC000708]